MCFFLGTNTREMMNESRISRAVVVATSSFMVWGFECECLMWSF
jgi:hypothetical protein